MTAPTLWAYCPSIGDFLPEDPWASLPAGCNLWAPRGPRCFPPQRHLSATHAHGDFHLPGLTHETGIPRTCQESVGAGFSDLTFPACENPGTQRCNPQINCEVILRFNHLINSVC